MRLCLICSSLHDFIIKHMQFCNLLKILQSTSLNIDHEYFNMRHNWKQNMTSVRCTSRYLWVYQNKFSMWGIALVKSKRYFWILIWKMHKRKQPSLKIWTPVSWLSQVKLFSACMFRFHFHFWPQLMCFRQKSTDPGLSSSKHPFFCLDLLVSLGTNHSGMSLSSFC